MSTKPGTVQTSANDNNANLKYPTLDGSIADTYAKLSTATNKNSLYDSYIRAYRWATNRLEDRGIMAYVSNGGWLDGNTADGMRLSMAQDFSHIWIFNLRGNTRTAGELARKEGGQTFGSGSRNTVAIVLGIIDPDYTGTATIHYRDIGDYLTREDKLNILTTANVDDAQWQTITPNSHGDWLNQRDDAFGTYPGITEMFTSNSRGVETTRDAWCYNFSAAEVEDNMRRMIDTYNTEAISGYNSEAQLTDDSRSISWSRNIKRMALKGQSVDFHHKGLRRALYRPFTHQALYFDKTMNSVPGQNGQYFPTPVSDNVGFLVIEPNQRTPFSVMATNLMPDSKTYVDAAQFFPRWRYEQGPKRAEAEALFDETGELVDGYRRIDNITDHSLTTYRQAFGVQVTKDDIFRYVYGVLHSTQYRERFAADLTKMLPRIPLATNTDDFHSFADAGKQLMDLHINYEDVEPYPLKEQITPAAGMDEYELFSVGAKMKFPKAKGVTDRSNIIYNPQVTLRGIPDEAHRYQLGSRSAIEWIIDRYWVRTDKASGIVNDPNAWSQEHHNPRYIIDLIKKVTTVSVETMKIVDSLPSLTLEA